MNDSSLVKVLLWGSVIDSSHCNEVEWNGSPSKLRTSL